MSSDAMAWVALAMVAGGMVWWFRRVGRVQVPQNRTPFLAWSILGGVLAVFAIADGSGWTTWLPAGAALLGALFVVATISISRQKVEGALGVGDAMPVFQAPDESGALFDSASLAGRPVLLKFFRGHW